MKLEKIFRIFLGIMFLMTGMMKIALPDFGNAFMIQLIEAKIPFPEINFWIVPIIELAIGAMLLFNYKTLIPLLTVLPIMFIALYVHLVVSNPGAFPAQPKFPIIPIIVIIIDIYLLIKMRKNHL